MADAFARRLAAGWRDLVSSGLAADERDFEAYQRLARLRFVNVALLLGTLLGVALAVIGRGPLLTGFDVTMAVLLAAVLLALRRHPSPLLGGAAILAVFTAGQVIDVLAAGNLGGLRFAALIVYPVIAFFVHGARGGLIAVGLFLLVQALMAAGLATGLVAAPYPVRTMVTGVVASLGAGVFAFLAAEAYERLSRMMAAEIFCDRLTGLPNRARLLRDLADTSVPALLLVNLDDFKAVNMLFGYRTGDAVLQFIAGVLVSIVEPFGGRLYRLAADEFAALLDPGGGSASRSAMERIAREAHEAVGRSRFDAAGTEIILRVSVGAALVQETGRDLLLPSADAALKAAKQARRPYVVGGRTEDDRSFLEADMRRLQVLSDALAADRVFPFYQPIVSNATGELVRFECLARIIDGSGGVVSPARFLDVAKRSRLYPKITLAMLRRTFAAFEDNDLEFSINLSAGDFTDPYILQFIDLAVTQSPAVARRLWFEILESEGIDNFEQARDFISRMKMLGCRVALDDFGSGYSNFESVLRLELDCVKIDGSLIRRIDTDNGARVLVENIVGFSRRLGLATVAEYVHSEPVFRVVKELGIDCSQGYLLGEPAPAIDEAVRMWPLVLRPE